MGPGFAAVRRHAAPALFAPSSHAMGPGFTAVRLHAAPTLFDPSSRAGYKNVLAAHSPSLYYPSRAQFYLADTTSYKKT